jgi:hypothetical protein
VSRVSEDNPSGGRRADCHRLPVSLGTWGRVGIGAGPCRAAASAHPVRDQLTEIPGAQAAALSLALGWGPAAAPSERFLVAAAVLSMLAAESEGAPVLVLVDDLQWVDRESAAALGFAARRLREDRVCFVWAARSGSISPEFVQGMPVLTLGGLSPADALALMPDRVADGVVERLVDDTGGNPLGILEIARRLTDAQRVGAAPLPNALPVGDRLGACTSNSSPAYPHRPGAPYCCPHSIARAPPQRCRQRWSGRGWTLRPQWTRPMTTAYWCITGRRSASAIRCCERQCWLWRLRRNSGRRIAH